MSHASEIAHSADDMIVAYPPRESGIVDYRLGRNITVSYRGHDRLLCHTCVKVDDCEHSARVRRYREEHP